jgi:hypothetical protein
MLAPLREVADEIVVAVDATVDAQSIVDLYPVADRLVRFEFPDYLERGLAWLHGLCSSDWILRLDGDEVVSPALVDELPTLIRESGVRQFHLPTRRLWPSPDRWLDEWPWSPDYHNRLVRNDSGLWFPGFCHSGAEPALPARYLELPIYHLDGVLNDERTRELKVARYLALPPGESALGADRLLAQFYLPERYATEPPAPVPRRDQEAIEAVLEGNRSRRRGRLRDLPLVTRPEVESHWARRSLAEGAYQARVELIEEKRRMTMQPREQRLIKVRVTNLGTETWPGFEERAPLIRLGCRWLRSDGTAANETARTTLPEPVAPRGSTIVPVFVEAPPERASYALEIDLVHEFQRWFGVGTEIAVRVERRD